MIAAGRPGIRNNVATGATVVGRNAAGTGGATLTVPMPTHQAGDLLIFAYATFGGWASVGATPSGWTVISKYDGVNEAGVSIYRKVAASSSETASAQPYGGGAGDSAGVVYVFRGATYDTFAVTHAEAVTSCATPTLTATGTGLELHLWTVHKAFSGASGTEDAAVSNTAHASFVTKWIGAGTEPRSAGTTTARTATSGSAVAWTAAQVSVKAT